MISCSIEIGISELTRKEMTSRIKHVGATHQSLLAKAWASVASATPCISFDVAELLLKEIYEQHSANPKAVANILGEHFEYFINKACLYTELKAAEKSVHEIAAKYMGTKKPETHVKVNGAKDFADAFAMLLNTLNEIEEAISKNKEKAAEPIKEGEKKYDLSKYTMVYYITIEQSKTVSSPINFIQEKIKALNELRKSLNVSKIGFRLCTNDISGLQDYLNELRQQVADPVI
ncbi:hypothetical protein ACFOWM_03320 [Ferruginibacter yonginensis]|uniref:Uncharacterized protein n=1 Tax=Ferruginibacter yonginensis TaxID=1310416 RepID=A0ABV8QQC1_9BACT